MLLWLCIYVWLLTLAVKNSYLLPNYSEVGFALVSDSGVKRVLKTDSAFDSLDRRPLTLIDGLFLRVLGLLFTV